MRLPLWLFLLLTAISVGFGALFFSLKSINNASAGIGCAPLTADGVFDPIQTTAYWNGAPQDFIPQIVENDPPASKVLGDSSSKWIEIDLSDQKLIAHEGDGIFLTSLISSGLYGRTQPGEYNIWYKIKYTKMEGGSKLNNSYYYLPNVPFTMFFKGDYGIHGTYWHNNFGTPMSHGCVNSPTPVAERLFYWTTPTLPEGKSSVRATADNPGTRVVIHQ